MKKLNKYTNILLIVLFIVLILLRSFVKLDAIGMTDLDESKHAAEAYEMFQRKAWIAHTYYWEIDYFNSKPPLYYWLTNIFFSVLGVSMVNFKLPSVISGILLSVILSVFLYRLIDRRFDKKYIPLVSIPLFLAAYLAMDSVYDFHGYRAGNFDGIYTLFVLVAMIFVVKARQDNKYLIPMGAFMALAFLSKGFNTASIVFCAICSVPFLAKEKRIRYILLSILTAILVVLPWAALRFRFDGTAFFYQMVFGEAEDKVVGGSLEYFQSLPSILTFRLLFYGLIFYLVAIAMKERSVKGFFKALLSDLKENALLWIWMWVPILFYSWAGSCNDWYIYSSYVVAALLFAVHFASGLNALSDAGPVLMAAANILALALLATTAIHGVNKITWWNEHAGQGGGPAYSYWDDMKAIKEAYGDAYQGSYVYMEDVSRYNSDNIVDELTYDILAYSEYECDWHGMKGGISDWEKAEEGILVVNKDILDQFIARLSGHVIIQDGGYAFFIHDRY